MFLEDSQIFHLQFLKIEDYIQNFCHKFHIHNFYEPYTELRSEKFIFSIYSSIFHSQSWKTACFPALGQENRFSDLQTMNFFFSAWNENSTIIKENLMHRLIIKLVPFLSLKSFKVSKILKVYVVYVIQILELIFQKYNEDISYHYLYFPNNVEN